MKDPIYVVTQEEFDRARKMEQMLLSSGGRSGILFAGVRVTKNEVHTAPETEVHTEYRVVVGYKRSLDVSEHAMAVAVATLLKAEFKNEPWVFIETHRGVGP